MVSYQEAASITIHKMYIALLGFGGVNGVIYSANFFPAWVSSKLQIVASALSAFEWIEMLGAFSVLLLCIERIVTIYFKIKQGRKSKNVQVESG